MYFPPVAIVLAVRFENLEVPVTPAASNRVAKLGVDVSAERFILYEYTYPRALYDSVSTSMAIVGFTPIVIGVTVLTVSPIKFALNVFPI